MESGTTLINQWFLRVDEVFNIAVNATGHIAPDGHPDAEFLWAPPPGDHIKTGDTVLVLKLERVRTK
jgi:hypothetical protein